jgi:hypothetical protein
VGEWRYVNQEADCVSLDGVRLLPRLTWASDKNINRPVGDRDHEVLGVGSFGKYT